MTLESKLAIKIPQINREEDIQIKLEEVDINLLHKYLAEVKELSTLPILRTLQPMSFSIEYINGILKIEYQLPGDTDIASLLHRIRPFILANEPYSFDKIISVLGRTVDNKLFRQLLKGCREVYSGLLMKSQVQVYYAGVLVNSDDTLMRWLNACEYHRDSDKAKMLEDIHRLFPLDSSKFFFLTQIKYKIQAIYELAAWIEVILGNITHIEGILWSTRRLP